MQKLSVELKNIPTDTPLVCSPINSVLNRDQSLSVQDIVLTDNNFEVDLSQHKGSQVLRVPGIVYVLNMRGFPLMPTSQKKAKTLVKIGRAKIVKRKPFTVQLTRPTGESKQDVILGVDSGYKFIGFSAITEKREVVSGTLELDTKTSDRLKEKAMYRRNRRNRLWYRKQRFSNRSMSKGLLPPSIQRRYDTHINLISRIKKLLPITKVIVEIGNFDIQKINNPDITNIEYQQGNLYGYLNMKSYIVSREKGLCQLCKKRRGKNSWNLHHILERSKGGTDKESNLALLHKSCHSKLHKENIKLKGENKKYKASTFMNIIKNKFTEDLKCELTYGYITSTKRIELNIEKTHNNDAFCIADGNNQERCGILNIKQKHRNNRKLQINRRGFKPSIRKQRYSIQPMDLIRIDNKICTTSGTHCNGNRVMVNRKSINIKKLNNWRFNFGSFIYT